MSKKDRQIIESSGNVFASIDILNKTRITCWLK